MAHRIINGVLVYVYAGPARSEEREAAKQFGPRLGRIHASHIGIRASSAITDPQSDTSRAASTFH